jgi:hypothetical protein
MLYLEVDVVQEVGMGTGMGTLVGVVVMLFLGSSLRRLEMLMDFVSWRGDRLRCDVGGDCA